MNDKFEKEFKIVIDAVKKGITANIDLSEKQKKYLRLLNNQKPTSY